MACRRFTRAELLPLTLELSQLKIDVVELADAINHLLLTFARIPAGSQDELASHFDSELRNLNHTLEATTTGVKDLTEFLDAMREAEL